MLETKITQHLDQMIIIGNRKYNYLQYYSDRALINELKNLNRDYIYIHNNNYVFIEAAKVEKDFRKKAIEEIETILIKR